MSAYAPENATFAKSVSSTKLRSLVMSLTFVGTEMFAVAFWAEFAVKVVTVVPFF